MQGWGFGSTVQAVGVGMPIFGKLTQSHSIFFPYCTEFPKQKNSCSKNLNLNKQLQLSPNYGFIVDVGKAFSIWPRFSHHCRPHYRERKLASHARAGTRLFFLSFHSNNRRKLYLEASFLVVHRFWGVEFWIFIIVSFRQLQLKKSKPYSASPNR